MSIALLSERRGVLYFFLLLLITVFIFFQNHHNFSFLGGITIFWGLFGFYRYLYLSGYDNKKIPTILTLPSRILFGFYQQRENNIELILERFLQKNTSTALLLTMMLMGWGVYCFFDPIEISAVQNFWLEKQKILEEDITLQRDYLSLLKVFSIFFIFILVGFVGFSFLQTPLFFKVINVFIIPFSAVLFIYIALTTSWVEIDVYRGFSSLKGMGWGQFEVFQALVHDSLMSEHTFFSKRYIETGLIGACGPYVVFAFLFINGFKILQSNMPRLFVWMMGIIAIFVLDFVLIEHAMTLSNQLFLFIFIICYGAYIPQKSS